MISGPVTVNLVGHVPAFVQPQSQAGGSLAGKGTTIGI